MVVTGQYQGKYCRFAVWILGEPAHLHFNTEKIEVKTVSDIRQELEKRGVTKISVTGEPWEFANE